MRSPPIIISTIAISIIAVILFSSLVLAQDTGSFQVHVVPINWSDTIKPCEVASFSFEVQNPIDQVVTLDLGASPFEEGVFFSENPLVLSPGQIKPVLMYIIPPCEQYGTIEVELVARSRFDGRQVSFPLGVLEIASDGIIEIAKGVSRVRIDYNRSGVFIPIKNIGLTDSNYDFSTEGPSWISVRPIKLALASNTQGQIQLILDPPTNVENGVYRVVLFAKANETGVEYGRQLEVVLAPYTTRELFLNQYRQWLIVGAVILVLGILGGLMLIIYLLRTQEKRAQARLERQEGKEKKRVQKEEERNVKEKERLVKGKEAIANSLLSVFKANIIKEHGLYTFEGRKVRTWVKQAAWTLAILILICAVGIVGVNYPEVLAPFALPWIAGIGTVFGVVILIRLCQAAKCRHWRSKYSEKELEDLIAKARVDLEQEFVLVPKSILSLAKKDRPFWLWVVLAVGALVVAMAAIIIAVWKTEFPGGWLAVSGTLGVLAMVLVIVLVALIQQRKRYVKFILLPSVSPGQKYEVGTNWNDDFSELVFIPKIRKSGVLITTRRFDHCPAFIEPDTPVYQYVEVQVDGLMPKDFQPLEVRFKVKKDWLVHNRSIEKDISLLRYDSSRSRWIRCGILEVVDSDNVFVSLVAKEMSPGVLAVSAKPSLPAPKSFWSRWFSSKEESQEIETRQFAKLQEAAARRREVKEAKEPSKKRMWRWIVYGIVALIMATVLAGAIYVTITQTPSLTPISSTSPAIQEIIPSVPGGMQNNGIPIQSWRQNSVQSLDLSKYFSDPDNDVLSFSHTPVTRILIEYNGSIARLIPETDFVGEATTIFTATDKEGRSVSSNLVRLIVQPGPQSFQKQVLDFVKVYVGYIVAGLISLAVVVASIFLLRKGEDKSEKE